MSTCLGKCLKHGETTDREDVECNPVDHEDALIHKMATPAQNIRLNMYIKERIKILLVVVLLFMACIGVYQNREPIHKWWKRQVIEFKLIMLKQLLNEVDGYI